MCNTHTHKQCTRFTFSKVLILPYSLSMSWANASIFMGDDSINLYSPSCPIPQASESQIQLPVRHI